MLRDTGSDIIVVETRDSEGDIMYINSTIMSTVPLAELHKPGLSRAKNPGGFAVVTSNKTAPPPSIVDLFPQRIQALAGGALIHDHLALEESNFDAHKTMYFCR